MRLHLCLLMALSCGVPMAAQLSVDVSIMPRWLGQSQPIISTSSSKTSSPDPGATRAQRDGKVSWPPCLKASRVRM